MLLVSVAIVVVVAVQDDVWLLILISKTIIKMYVVSYCLLLVIPLNKIACSHHACVHVNKSNGRAYVRTDEQSYERTK